MSNHLQRFDSLYSSSCRAHGSTPPPRVHLEDIFWPDILLHFSVKHPVCFCAPCVPLVVSYRVIVYSTLALVISHLPGGNSIVQQLSIQGISKTWMKKGHSALSPQEWLMSLVGTCKHYSSGVCRARCLILKGRILASETQLKNCFAF